MPPALSKSLRIAAVVLAGAVTGFWITSGAHTGWSMNKVPITQTDEITGLTYTEYEERYVPGLEVLIGAWGGSVILFGASFVGRRSQSSKRTN